MDSITRLSYNQYMSYFSDFKRCLKKGGTLFVHLPTKAGLWYRGVPSPHYFLQDELIDILDWAEIEFLSDLTLSGVVVAGRKK